MSKKILRRTDVENIVGLSCSTIYRLMDEGKFPRPIRLSQNSVGWLESDIDKWLTARIAESKAS